MGSYSHFDAGQVGIPNLTLFPQTEDKERNKPEKGQTQRLVMKHISKELGITNKILTSIA